MTEQYDAVVLILDRLQNDGLKWYRNAVDSEADLFENLISSSFAIFETGEIYTIGRKPRGSFPPKKLLVMAPPGRKEKAFLGLWLRWNFEANPFEFRIFLGHWSEIEQKKTFLAFRFEAPEQGDEHNYYHCQPCRNFGDKEIVPNAALVSEHFPTIPLNATNIVELAVCALLSSMGHKKLKIFLNKLRMDPAAAGNASLKAAYDRYCS